MLVRKPTLGQVAVIAGFALSCFGLLVFLWVAFGGPIPFKPEGYRVKVPFDEGTQLAVESDVRISNVSVGKVKEIELGDEGDQDGLAVARSRSTLPMRRSPRTRKAILRSKTLLGETYVELTPGNNRGPRRSRRTAPCPERRSPTRSSSTRSSAPSIRRTRAAFQTWMQEAAVSLNGRGLDLNAALGNLDAFAQDATRLLARPRHPERARPAASSATPASSSTRSQSARASSRA